MIRTNLSTRPFYNVRAVQVALSILAAIVVGITLFNVIRIVTLLSSQQTLGATADESEREAARLRSEASRIRAQINPAELETVATAAREANNLIDQRAFSWTELFSQFEATLPDDVRITAVQPRLEKGVFIVAVAIEARRAEDLDAFIEALEMTGNFHNVLATETQTNAENLLEAIVEGIYQPPSRTASPETTSSDAASQETASEKTASPEGGKP
jgi:Tfp pilus assembly protein PilN